LVFDFPDRRSYEIAPPIRDIDRLIVFLRPGDKPTNWTMLTSAIWLQDGVAYAFEQTMNPGPTHLVAFSSVKERFENGNLSNIRGGTAAAGTVRDVDTWAFDNFGEILVAVATAEQAGVHTAEKMKAPAEGAVRYLRNLPA